MNRKKPNSIDIIIAENLKRLRRKHAMSQAELGRCVGITFQQIQKYENVTNRIPASRLYQIARALDEHVARFFERV